MTLRCLQDKNILHCKLKHSTLVFLHLQPLADVQHVLHGSDHHLLDLVSSWLDQVHVSLLIRSIVQSFNIVRHKRICPRKEDSSFKEEFQSLLKETSGASQSNTDRENRWSINHLFV